MRDDYSAALDQLAEHFSLENLTPGLSLKGRNVVTEEINRAALQLTGYYEYFDPKRVQLIGMVEHSYLASLDVEERRTIFERLFSTHIVCLIVCRGLGLFKEDGIPELAEQYDVPLFSTDETTSVFTVKLIEYLREELAPRVMLHGVMVDCYGEGVLIMGDSGVGKSETALELVQRGHRLIADDVVEIRKTSETELMARSVDVIRNLIELRGIGVINVKELYGVQSIRLSKTIDMVIKLEPWSPEKQYDRMGLEKETTDILGTSLVLYSIPIMVGRNLAMIIETAALNHRQKKMGYNAAEELRDRVNENIARRRSEREKALEEAKASKNEA